MDIIDELLGQWILLMRSGYIKRIVHHQTLIAALVKIHLSY